MKASDLVTLLVYSFLTPYSEEPPRPTRPTSRISHHSRGTSERDGLSVRSPSPISTNRSVTPTQTSHPQPADRGRAESVHSRERRPKGPRAPSPLPPISPTMQAIQLDIDGALESTLANIPPHRSRTPGQEATEDADPYSDAPGTPSRLPRSRRQPFIPTGNADATPKNTIPPSSGPKSINGIEPLSIKKKISNATPASARRSYARDSPLAKHRDPKAINKQQSASPHKILEPTMSGSSTLDTEQDSLPYQLVHLAETTKEDVSTSFTTDSSSNHLP